MCGALGLVDDGLMRLPWPWGMMVKAWVILGEGWGGSLWLLIDEGGGGGLTGCGYLPFGLLIDEGEYVTWREAVSPVRSPYIHVAQVTAAQGLGTDPVSGAVQCS